MQYVLTTLNICDGSKNFEADIPVGRADSLFRKSPASGKGRFSDRLHFGLSYRKVSARGVSALEREAVSANPQNSAHAQPTNRAVFGS